MSASVPHNVSTPTPLAESSFYNPSNDHHYSESTVPDPSLPGLLNGSEPSEPPTEEEATYSLHLPKNYILASSVNAADLRRGLGAIERNEKKNSDKYQSLKLGTGIEKSTMINGEEDHLQETAC
ncbi:MAG: hypothetical protein ACOYK6_02230 [Chthoniobacterales bacterium]